MGNQIKKVDELPRTKTRETTLHGQEIFPSENQKTETEPAESDDTLSINNPFKFVNNGNDRLFNFENTDTTQIITKKSFDNTESKSSNAGDHDQTESPEISLLKSDNSAYSQSEKTNANKINLQVPIHQNFKKNKKTKKKKQ